MPPNGDRAGLRRLEAQGLCNVQDNPVRSTKSCESCDAEIRYLLTITGFVVVSIGKVDIVE